MTDNHFHINRFTCEQFHAFFANHFEVMMQVHGELKTMCIAAV